MKNLFLILFNLIVGHLAAAAYSNNLKAMLLFLVFYFVGLFGFMFWPDSRSEKP